MRRIGGMVRLIEFWMTLQMIRMTLVVVCAFLLAPLMVLAIMKGAFPIWFLLFAICYQMVFLHRIKRNTNTQDAMENTTDIKRQANIDDLIEEIYYQYRTKCDMVNDQLLVDATTIMYRGVLKQYMKKELRLFIESSGDSIRRHISNRDFNNLNNIMLDIYLKTGIIHHGMGNSFGDKYILNPRIARS